MTTKKKTIEQKIEDGISKAFDKHQQGTTISDCNFIGAKFDEAATEAITTIAEGLLENAKALGTLVHVLKASNVEIETMVEINGS